MNMERIEHYSDYRQFLKDYYKERKKQFRFFSYRYFCKKAEIKSPALFREVIEGKRNLTLSTIRSFMKGMELTETDGRFFSALVLFNQARTPGEKQEYLEQLRGMRRKVKLKTVPLDLYAYYSKWYHPVLRELVCLLDWKEDYSLLARSINPAIGAREAKEAVELLLSLGFVKKEADGRYRQYDPAITTGPEVVSPAIRELNRQMAELGERAIRVIPPSKRDASSLTLGLSEKSYQLAKQEIQEFKNRLIRIAVEDTASDKVFNLNVHLFPLSGEASKQGVPR